MQLAMYRGIPTDDLIRSDIDAVAGSIGMTAEGTVNFGKSQTLKTQLAAATAVAQVNALAWV